MNFKYKCLMQSIFSSLPKGEMMNYLFQKHITKTLPPKNEKFLIKVNEAYQHYNNYANYNKLETKSYKYYEFGAGWNLVVPLSMTYLGFEVHCVDIRKLIIPELIKHSLEKFEFNKSLVPFKLEQIRKMGEAEADILAFLKETHGLAYYAPADARSTGFMDQSFDFISSTATLEHIPEDDILLILKECFRILNTGGILSISIDYKDHWSYFDKSISIYNFLKYSSRVWKRYNPSLHYQNRLRHSDYMALIAQSGFQVVKDTPILPNDSDVEILRVLDLSDEFVNYEPVDLAIRGSEIVLMKPT